MDSSEWHSAIQLAVRLGLGAPRREAPAPDAPTVRDLAAHLGLPESAVEELLRLSALDAPSANEVPTLRLEPVPTPTQSSPDTIFLGRPPRPDLPAKLGPYELFEELGHGGMGVVHRARHERLGTLCAVKVLIAGKHASPEEIARFEREASAVARMGKHPNIVSVHDLDREGGHVFYAMDLVEGKSLRRLLAEKDVPARDAASIVERVARALHFAHGRGIVHRDVKPDNILVQEGGEPQVMDFGLARDVGADDRLSVSGQVMGTLAYMAPEQARGDVDATDARTDVYALGGVLYELLAGLPPHGGRTAALVLPKILRGEIVPPRRIRSEAPRDLETICMKSLELDPARRYPSAEALADDLARWQRGEPIQARPVTWLHRAWIRARRNPAVSLLSAALLVAALGGGALAWRAWERDREARRAREELIDQNLRDLARSGRALVDAALARRAVGDLGGMIAYATEMDEIVGELSRLAPHLAEPWYHRGRMDRARGRFQEAEAAQDRAVALAEAPTATGGSRALLSASLFERGVLRQLRYEETREELAWELVVQRGSGAAVPEIPSVAEIESHSPSLVELKRAALADLDRAEAGLSDEARRSYARALKAMVGAAPTEEVERAFAAALAADPYLIEAHAHLGDRALEEGRVNDAIRWFQTGTERDRGFLGNWLGLADARLLAARQEAGRGREAGALFQGALDACGTVLAAIGDSPDGWKRRVDIFNAWAEVLERLGADASEKHALALEAAREQARLLPARTWAHIQHGSAALGVAFWQRRRDEDPAAALEEAMAAFDKAASLDSASGAARAGLADVYRVLGRQRATSGDSPTEAFQRAVDLYGESLALNPRGSVALSHLGACWFDIGEWRERNGEDPSEAYAKGIEALDRALGIDPESVEAAHNRGVTLGRMAAWRDARGMDPTHEYQNALDVMRRLHATQPFDDIVLHVYADAALGFADWLEAHGRDPSHMESEIAEACRRSIACHPGFRKALLLQAELLSREGTRRLERGEDPTRELESAIDAIERLPERRPDEDSVDAALGAAWLALARWRARTKGEAGDAFGRAVGRLEQRATAQPRDPGAQFNLGLARMHRAVWRAGGGEEASDDLDACVAAMERSVALAPASRSYQNGLATACQTRGELLETLGADGLPSLTRAREVLDGVVRQDPEDAEAVYIRSYVCQAIASARQRRGQDPSGDFIEAMAGFKRALAIDPSHFPSHVCRGGMLATLGRFEEAVAEYEWAARVDPRFPGLEDSLAQARAAAAAAPRFEGALGMIAAARGQLQDGEHLAAREGIERGLAEWEKELAAMNEEARLARLAEDRVRGLLRDAHYDLACLLTDASLGTAGPWESPPPARPENVPTLREGAFAHLQAAIELGFGDRAQAERDEQLAPLRDDARWQATLERMGR